MANTFDTNVSLTPKQLKVLKAIRKGETKLYASPDNNMAISYLSNKCLITAKSIIDDSFGIVPDYSTCKITEDGRDYIRHNKWLAFRFYLPVFLSIVSVILSIIAIIISIKCA